MKKQVLLPDIDISDAGLYDSKLTRDPEQIAALTRQIVEAEGEDYNPESITKYWAGMPGHMTAENKHPWALNIRCGTEEEVYRIVKAAGLKVAKTARQSVSVYSPAKSGRSGALQHQFDWVGDDS